jgi:hypothetical protein
VWVVAKFTIKDNVRGYRQMLDIVASTGAHVAPRGQDCLEVRNVTIEHVEPSDVLATGCGRNFNVRLAAYESLCLIAGVSYPSKALAVAPNLAAFTNEEGEFDGAYGPRTTKQLAKAVEKLRVDPDTRQACVVLWRSWDLDMPTKDLPCTVYLNFSIRDGKLLMTTHMRSQDLWWGWPYDVVQFTQLGWTVANVLGLEMGPYVHNVDSLHIYTRNGEDIYKFTHYNEPDQDRQRMRGINGKSWSTAVRVAHQLLNDDEMVDWAESAGLMSDTELWFADRKLWEY